MTKPLSTHVQLSAHESGVLRRYLQESPVATNDNLALALALGIFYWVSRRVDPVGHDGIDVAFIDCIAPKQESVQHVLRGDQRFLELLTLREQESFGSRGLGQHGQLCVEGVDGNRTSVRIRVEGEMCGSRSSLEPQDSGTRDISVDIEINLPSHADESSLRALNESAVKDTVRDVLAFPDRSLATVGGPSENERIEQQYRWNQTDRDRDRPDLISLLLDRAERTPEAPAVVHEDLKLTYSELVAHATSVAKELRANGIGDGESVGISLPRSAEMIVGIVAVLLAGGSFVPLDPSWPESRRESVSRDAGLVYVLTEANCVVGESSEVGVESARKLFTPPSEDDVAYVIFTSGSTGRPKGAMIRHGAIVERLLWQRDQILVFGQDDASLFKAPLAFDISINEIFLPLVSGGRVVVAEPGVEQDPTRLARLIHKEQVTFAYLVSSVLDVMLWQSEHTNLLESLRHLWCGGEMLTQALFQRFRRQLAIPLYHGYGPAEATIGVSHVIYRGDEDRLNTSIGVANPNCRLYVLDENLRVVPHQEIGELYVAGYLLSEGYINAPGLTASRFVADVFASDGSRMYRTGDLVRRLDDGSLEFVGRSDNQVKIRGMRLELEDVESALVGHPAVESASVIAREGRLLGYVTVDKASTDASALGTDAVPIRNWCADFLPEYMVPAIVTVLDELPRTVNGKVDRRALPEPTWTLTNDSPADAERDGETVALIAEAMAETLKIPSSGAHTDFFDIGGDSLRAITLLSILGRRGIEVSVGDIFTARTPHQLARLAEDRDKHAEDPDDNPVGEVDSLPILRWFDSVAQHFDGFIQSVEFAVPDCVDEQLARQMISKVLDAHPALTARVHRNPLRLELPDTKGESAVVLAQSTDTDALVSLLDPDHGVVLVAGLIPGRLRLVAHHLVVDGVSWGIIGEDLAAAYRGEELLAERTSLRRWSQLLQSAVDRGSFAEQASASLATLPDVDEPLHEPQLSSLTESASTPATVRDERSVVHETSVQTTEEVLQKVPQAFRTGANAVLLTALSVTLARWRRSSQTWSLVELEGHGRETRYVPGPHGREADLSRTVGWFTCLYPVLIDPTDAALDSAGMKEPHDTAAPPLALALNAVKDQLNAIPGNGVPYQAQTWLGHAAETHSQAQVLFNYLGRVSTGAGDFLPAESTGQLGERRDPRQPLVRELEFNAIAEETDEGYVLRTTISWANGRISQDRIDELLETWDAALQEVAALSEVRMLSQGDVEPAPVTAEDLAHITTRSTKHLVDVLPLTALQHGMYFQALFDESASTYVEQQVLHVECSETFDRERFTRAVRRLVQRHPSLSARPWETSAGDMVAVIDPGIAENMHVNYVGVAVPDTLGENELSEWLMQRAEVIAAEDLTQGIALQPVSADGPLEPLMRWTVLLPSGNAVDQAMASPKTTGQESGVPPIAVIQTVHHFVADGWSVPIMLRDVLEIYRDDDARIPRYNPQAGIAGSVRWVARRDHEEDLGIWRSEMFNARPTVLCSGASQSLERRELDIRDTRVAQLSQRAREAGVGVPDVVHAAWGLVLRALIGCEPGADVVFATSVSGRDIPVPGVTDAVGMQLNTIPVVAPGEADPTLPITSLLRAMMQHNNRVRDVQYVSLSDIARDMGTNASELLDTLMVVEVPLSAEDLDCPGSPLTVADVRNNGVPHFPLSVVVNPSADNPLRLIYDPQRISDLRVERIAQMLAESVDSLLSGAGSVTTVGEISTMLGSIASSAADSFTLDSLWRRNTEHFNDRIALSCVDDSGAAQQWTYKQLDDKAQSLLAELERRVRVDKPRVALLLDRDVWQVAAIVATALSGGTFIPVDSLSPQDRIELIVDSCQPDAVIVSPSARETLDQMVDCPVIVASEGAMRQESQPRVPLTGAVASRNTKERVDIRADEDDIAYVIYTSGSTGRPKGVAVTHANVVSMLQNARSHVEFSKQDVWSISHSFAFDFSVWELWGAFSSGGHAVVMPYALMRSPEDAGRVLQEQGVTILSQTPTSFSSLEPYLGAQSAVRVVVFGGESLEAKTAASYCAAHPRIRFINMYGITETTVHVTAHECSVDTRELKCPIGHPMDGLRVYVLDDNLQPVRAGETGIIYVSGSQVTAGYMGLPGMTASRFVADPFTGDGSRMYCSNDLATVLSNGHLDYVGRADRQVQLRGYRVERGEIEAALEAVPGVREAAVVIVETPEGQVAGALLIVDPREDANAVIARAAAKARKALPAYMVPQRFAVRAEMPQTINGKRDDSAVVELLGEDVEQPKQTDSSDTVEVIARAIAEALRLDPEQVDADSDFFRLGGDSILAIRVTHVLARAELSVTPRDFFLGRTPRLIAERVEAKLGERVRSVNKQNHTNTDEQMNIAYQTSTGPAEEAGAFPASAMLRRQLSLGMSDRFVQARRLDLGPVGVEQLRQAVQLVAEAHPMLRAQVETHRAGEQAEAQRASVRFVIPEPADSSVHKQGEEVGPLVLPTLSIDTLIEHIDLERGRTLVLGCVDGYVKAVAHHAVIDSTSWIIVEDDLRDAVAGRKVLREKFSYRALTQRELIDAHAVSSPELDHWTSVASVPRPVEGVNQWSANLVETTTVTIGGNTARIMQDIAPAVMGVEVRDLVTAVVTVAVARIMGINLPSDDDVPLWAVDVEGHGRPEDRDCARTIGWFTTISPVTLPLADAAYAARVAAEMRRNHEQGKAPDRRTYQGIRYTHPQGAELHSRGAQILVNYLGRGETDTVLSVPRDPACTWTNYLVETDVWASDQQLHMDLAVIGSLISAACLEAAINDVAQELCELVSHAEITTGRKAPLSVLQRGIWFQSSVSSPGAYVAQTMLTFNRKLDAEAVVEAFQDTVTVHPAMGASFRTDDSGLPEQTLPWSGHGINLPVEVIEGDVETIMYADRRAGVDLTHAPLAKAKIIPATGEQQGDTLLLTYHLILVDGWSRTTMLRTFLERLTARSGPEGSRENNEVVAAQPNIVDVLQDTVDETKEQTDSHYWAQRLRTLSQPTIIAPRAAALPLEPSVCELPRQLFAELDEDMTNALSSTIRTCGVTLTSVVNAAVAVALGQATGDPDVVFGQSVSGRDALKDSAASDVVGVLLNTVPIRVTTRPEHTLEQLVNDVHIQRIEDMEHDAADLGAIQKQLGVEALFDSMVVVQNFLDLDAAAELRSRHGVVRERAEDSTHFPLTWVFTPGTHLGIKLEFRQDLVDEDLAASVLETATSILRAYVDRADIPLAQLTSPSSQVHSGSTGASDAQSQIVSWQQGEGIERTIVHELADTARRFPENVAIVDSSQQWTFRDVVGRCSDLVRNLRIHEVSRGDTVAIAVERSAHSVIALLGALWAGVRYVPLDLTHPDGHLQAILEDSRPALVLVDPGSKMRMERLGDELCVDVTTMNSAAAFTSPVATPDDDAYLMYTSGSTGKPKGVVIQHRGLQNMLDNHRRKIFAPAARDVQVLRIAHAISFAFDMSWEELFWLAEGHEVCIFSEGLRRDATSMVEAIHEHQVDVINVTPTVAEQLIAEGMLQAGQHRPRVVLLGGEAVSQNLWNALRNAEGVRGYNLYGPTEYTINALGAGTDESALPVIGKPVDRTAAFVLDTWLRPVSHGMAGELYLAGSGLASEYFGLPARTASSMVACPWGAPGGRMYRTGDIVRLRADGLYEYLGRSDDQVKIRGHRVDPGDVSAAVMRSADSRILQCVTGSVDVSGSTALACHVVAPSVCGSNPTTKKGFLTAIRMALREELPSYMIPERWSIVEEIPMTSNGKADFAALGSGDRIAEQGREPVGEIEEVVAELFAESLDIEPEEVPADVDYFDLGGHSMAVIKLCALLRGEWGVSVGVREFYALRTVERVAKRVEEGAQS